MCKISFGFIFNRSLVSWESISFWKKWFLSLFIRFVPIPYNKLNILLNVLKNCVYINTFYLNRVSVLNLLIFHAWKTNNKFIKVKHEWFYTTKQN